MNWAKKKLEKYDHVFEGKGYECVKNYLDGEYSWSDATIVYEAYESDDGSARAILESVWRASGTITIKDGQAVNVTIDDDLGSCASTDIIWSNTRKEFDFEMQGAVESKQVAVISTKLEWLGEKFW